MRQFFRTALATGLALVGFGAFAFFAPHLVPHAEPVPESTAGVWLHPFPCFVYESPKRMVWPDGHVEYWCFPDRGAR